MPGPVPPSFRPRFSAYRLIGIVRSQSTDAPLPQVGTRVTPTANERQTALCAIQDLPLEDLQIHSHFEGDAVDRAWNKGFFVTVPRSSLSEVQLLRLWHRGLFQLSVGCTKSEDPLDAPPVPSPFDSSTQVQVRAFAGAPDADLMRVKSSFEREGDELLLCPWSEERARWQPVDYADEAARLATADLRQEKCALNPYAVLLVGGAGTRHEEDPAQDVIAVVVPWRQVPTTLDPQRTFYATVEAAQKLVAAMGGMCDARVIVPKADDLLDADPAAIARDL